VSGQSGFSAGVGRWAGSADVFDGGGHFVGGGADSRHVQPIEEGRVRIDVSFIGPFRHAGHYVIHDQGSRRIYEGPANVGYAECLCESLVDAHAYWPALGLSQRFFLMVLPGGKTQLSLALMSRGEQLMYAVVGQNSRVEGDARPPDFISGGAHDLGRDPNCGHDEILLNRAGTWRGMLTRLDANNALSSESTCTEMIERTNHGVRISRSGGFTDAAETTTLTCDGWQSWTPYSEPTAEVVGSASLYGGRALSGQFHHRSRHLRAWRREVITQDGTAKAVVNLWYAGAQRVGTEYGVLEFEPA
jgi:hypothetical protein